MIRICFVARIYIAMDAGLWKAVSKTLGLAGGAAPVVTPVQRWGHICLARCTSPEGNNNQGYVNGCEAEIGIEAKG